MNKANPQQQLAIEYNEGALAIIAGAGTGKTYTLTHRAAKLLNQSSKTLLLTFTNKAAKEMLERTKKLTDNSAITNYLTSGTFHSIAYKELKNNNFFSIIDKNDSRRFFQKELTDSPFHNTLTSKSLCDINSLTKNSMIDYESCLKIHYPQYLNHLDEIIILTTKYENYKKQLNVLDYDDLLINWLTQLKSRSKIDYDYILVDEFQDTSPLQMELLFLLTSQNNNITVVGDDCQAIYAFRGATTQQFQKFLDHYQDCEVITLTTNYRSTQSILDFSYDIIKSSKDSQPMHLQANCTDSSLPPTIIIKENPKQIAYEVIQKINDYQLLNITLSQQAILFRRSVDVIQCEVLLNKFQIPYKRYGGQKLADKKHIKEFINIFIAVTQINHEISWIKTLSLIKGIGKKKAAKLYLEITKQQLHNLPKEIICLLKIKSSSKIFLTELLQWYIPFLKNDKNSAKWLQELEIFTSSLHSSQSIDELLLNFYFTDEMNDNVLTLSTIHSAKGLEWENTFIIDISSESFSSNFPSEEQRLMYVACTRAKKNLHLYLPKTKKFLQDIVYCNPPIYLPKKKLTYDDDIIYVEENYDF